MATVNRVNPLNAGIPIVDHLGQPTLEFMLKWNAQQAKANAFTVRDLDVTFTDITTGNVSTTKHGYAPKLPNNANLFLNGVGLYTAPASGAISPPTAPLVSAFPTTINVASSTFTDTSGGIMANYTPDIITSDVVHGKTQNVAGTNWIATLGIIPYQPTVKTWLGPNGLILHDGTKSLILGVQSRNETSLKFDRIKYTNNTTYSADDHYAVHIQPGTPIFIRVARTTGNLVGSVSFDGILWHIIFASEAEFLTATTVGFGSGCRDTAASTPPSFLSGLVFYWENVQSSPAAIKRYSPALGGWGST